MQSVVIDCSCIQSIDMSSRTDAPESTRSSQILGIVVVTTISSSRIQLHGQDVKLEKSRSDVDPIRHC